MSYVWLSYPIGMNDPRPPAIPAPELKDFLTIWRDGASVQMLKIANHTGTHLDTAGHVIENGILITEFRPEDLIFNCIAVIDMHMVDAGIVKPEHLKPHYDRLIRCDMVMFRFGSGRIRFEDPGRYSQRSPGFGVDAAAWLREKCTGLRCIGIDTPSIATIAYLDETMPAHNILLEGNERRFLIIEEMNLDQNLNNLKEVRVNPWMVSGMNSGPCSVIGVMFEKIG